MKCIILLTLLIGCITVFVFSPFYSKSVLFVLDHFVPIEVNEVAAKSQQIAVLSEHNDLEPGSALWVARQAYLKVLQETAQKQDDRHLNLIAQRYQVLEARVQNKHDQELFEAQLQNPTENVTASEPMHHVVDVQHDAVKQKMLDDIAGKRIISNDENTQVLMDKYSYFLLHYPLELKKLPDQNQATQDLKQLSSPRTDSKTDTSKPSAIVVLGGGLSVDKNTKKIIVNSYTRLRLETTLGIAQQSHLPILLSGVEAPYMQEWLQQRGVDAKLLENKSMNTCENSRFSSLLLQKKGGAPKVVLITDAYHMPRTRRLFALNGVATIPVNAPMPNPLTDWQPALQNYDHSRRANYELLASIRDVLLGTSDCREVP